MTSAATPMARPPRLLDFGRGLVGAVLEEVVDGDEDALGGEGAADLGADAAAGAGDERDAAGDPEVHGWKYNREVRRLRRLRILYAQVGSVYSRA